MKGATVTGANHNHVSSLLGAHAVGALDDAEYELVTVHLAHCALCPREVARLQDSVERLPPAPDVPEELWQRIVDEVKRRQ